MTSINFNRNIIILARYFYNEVVPYFCDFLRVEIFFKTSAFLEFQI